MAVYHVLNFCSCSISSVALTCSCYGSVQVMFLVIDLEDEEFSKPMLAAYGFDTGKPAVSSLFKIRSSAGPIFCLVFLDHSSRLV